MLAEKQPTVLFQQQELFYGPTQGSVACFKKVKRKQGFLNTKFKSGEETNTSRIQLGAFRTKH